MENSRRRRADKGDSGEGCHCKKSNCLKKYCKCFNESKPCGSLCACEGCHNKYDDGDDREQLRLER